MEVEKQLPKSLRTLLRERVPDALPVAYACADLSHDGKLQPVALVLTEDTLLLIPGERNAETFFAGAQGKSLPTLAFTKNAALYTYPLAELTDPKIYNQVVGGMLTVRRNGEEMWLCRFTGAKMREMRVFTDALEARVQSSDAPKGAPPRPPKPTEEEAFCPKCGMPYPERGRAICPKCMEKRTIFCRVLSYFGAYKGRVAVMLLCIALSGVFNAVWPYLSGTVLYDQVLGQKGEWAQALAGAGGFALALGMLVLAMAGTKLLQQITGVLHGRMTAYMVPGVVGKLKKDVFAALQRLSISFFTRRQTGSLMQRVNGDANEVMHFFIDGLPYLLFNVLTILVTIGIMIAMDWRLAIAALFLLPPLFLISYRLLPNFWHAHGRRSRMVRSLYSVLNDGLTGARVVKAFGQEKNENRRFHVANERMRDAEMNVVKYSNTYNAAYSMARDIPTLLVWCVGAIIVLGTQGEFTYGKLLTFVNYLGMMQGPMEFFSQVFGWWSNSMNSAQRVFEIIDAVPEVIESENPLHIELKGDISLRHVSFGYEPNKPVLHDVSFDVKAGEMLGIVGKSGAGKSTLVNLISRLYDADSGEILLDGHNVKDISFASLHGSVAMVSQETYIFMGTVAENIAYARPQATREEIVNAAIAASAHRFICRLPDGYDTVIGTGGRQLSGGERQRLSIARAILADPQILVLDEATASVDTETERAIQDSLDRLIRGRTTISIAHRLSTLRNADRLIVLENGKLVESGTHAELVAQRGVYFKLLQLQSKALAMRGVGEDTDKDRR